MGLNIAALTTDVPAAVVAVETAYTGLKKLVDDAKAKASLTVDVADVEALLTPIESVVSVGEKVVGDL